MSCKQNTILLTNSLLQLNYMQYPIQEESPMKQSELQIKETEFRIEALQYLEFLYQEMGERRETLHSDILRVIESESVEELFSGFSLISSVSDSLRNRILRKDEIRDAQKLLEIMSTDLKNAGHEYLELEILLNRWTMFHKKTFSPEQ